jgi:hypothetical protein
MKDDDNQTSYNMFDVEKTKRKMKENSYLQRHSGDIGKCVEYDFHVFLNFVLILCVRAMNQTTIG